MGESECSEREREGKTHSSSFELWVVIEEVVAVDEDTGYYGKVPRKVKEQFLQTKPVACLPVEDAVEGQVVLSVLGVTNGDDLLETLEQQADHLQRDEGTPYWPLLSPALTRRERAIGPR